MNETPTTVALVKDEHGMPVGRILVEPDYDGGEGMNMNALIGGRGVTIAPVWVSRNTDEGFYQVGHDSRFLSALERFTEEFGYGTSWEFGGSAEIFQRYMRIFHPLVPVIDQWINTGYSQGDSVRVLAWAEPHKNDVSRYDETAYHRAARMHKAIEEQFLPMLGAHARNQYITTIYETMSVDQVIVEDEENIALTVNWEQQDCIGGTMYLKEFDPNGTAIETARGHFGLEGMTIEEV